MDDTYEEIAAALGRISGFGGFGAILGAIGAAVYNDMNSFRRASYGECAAYCAALAGSVSIGIEVLRVVG
ncbi:MAG TPA: hypothetical protein VIT89_03200 [Solirubrobacterales bacterium]